ncbi:hypothetical protein MPSEU_000397900 [Mayamaea pseudoterrestris]|nr:hypothetical protein MPSEU_000397900 [Mayamaea pseudoterrestris]
MSRQERLLKREMHTERHLMTLLQERKQLSDANFELQKRVLYWQHLTKQCDGCRERMARWKERRVQEKLQQQESETGLVTSASMDLEQVNEELTEVNGDEEDDVKPILNVSPITPPTTNKTVKPGMLRTSVQPASTGAEAAVRKPLMLSSPPPFSKTKPALRNSPSHTLATMSNAKESLEATGALAPPRLAAASPPSLNNKRTSASPPRPQPRTLTPPDKPLRGILKTNSSNSGATGDSKSQLSLMRNQNSIYITDLQNSTRNVLNTSSSNSSHIAPAPAAVLSSTSSMFSNSDESLSASRLDVSSVPQPQQHLKVLELGTLAELSSARSQLRQDNGEMSSAFHESQKTLDSTLPSDGSLVSLQDSSRLVLLDSSKLTASMTTTNTNSNSSGQLPFENYASSQGGGSAMHTHLPALSVSSASESASQLSRVSTTLRPGECHSKPAMFEAPATPVPKRPLKTSLKHRLSWPKKLLHRSNSADSGNGKDRSENSNETATYRSTAMATLRDRDQGKFGHS